MLDEPLGIQNIYVQNAFVIVARTHDMHKTVLLCEQENER